MIEPAIRFNVGLGLQNYTIMTLGSELAEETKLMAARHRKLSDIPKEGENENTLYVVHKKDFPDVSQSRSDVITLGEHDTPYGKLKVYAI